MTQRTKEVLATLTEGELLAFMCLLGAKEAAAGNGLSVEMLALRGGLASTDMPRAAIIEMREDVSGSYKALTTATQSLLAKLDGLLEETATPE